MNFKRIYSIFTITIFLVLLNISFATNAFAGTYRVKIIRVSTDAASGDVIIQIKPGKNETDFTGKARAMLVGSDPGTDRAMAVLLTAISLNAEMLIVVTNPPTFDDIQTISKTTLLVL